MKEFMPKIFGQMHSHVMRSQFEMRADLIQEILEKAG